MFSRLVALKRIIELGFRGDAKITQAQSLAGVPIGFGTPRMSARATRP